MKKYILIFILINIFNPVIFSVKRYPSLFRGKIKQENIIQIQQKQSVKNREIIRLKNELPIIIQNTETPDFRFSIYLQNPPLYQTYINSGTEKLLLLYIKETMTQKITNKYGSDFYFDIILNANHDFSSLIFNCHRDNYEKILSIIWESLMIKEINQRIFDIVNQKLQEDFQKYIQFEKNLIQQNFSSFLYKTENLSSQFYGNTISLSLITKTSLLTYYQNSFFVKRLVAVITMDIKNKQKIIKQLNESTSNFSFSQENKEYQLISKSIYQQNPKYYPYQKELTSVFFTGYFDAPSFLNDDYFTFLILMKILNKVTQLNISQNDAINWNSKMINLINYGEISGKCNEEKMIFYLLTLKRIFQDLQDNKKIYYYENEQGQIIDDFLKQTKQYQKEIKLNSLITEMKNQLYQEFNLSEIETYEKESKLISLFFLLGEFYKNTVIKQKIDQVNEEMVIEVFNKYLKDISWAVLANPEYLQNLSYDYFY
ncbi:MAG: hypothetical protein MJB14_19725 [Spirochaetes bacterium]|nr:hypothetical protein [Spirochaetota bacterium]